MIHPNKILIHINHSPERGSLFRFPANIERIKSGNPRPMLRVKKIRKPYRGSPF